MAYSEQVKYNFRCLHEGPVEVQKVTQVLKNGAPIGAALNHRQVVTPGDDISDLPEDAQNAINAHWTQARRSAWAARVAAHAEGV